MYILPARRMSIVIKMCRAMKHEQQRPPLQVIALKIVTNEWLDPFSARKSIVNISSLSLFSRGGQSLRKIQTVFFFLNSRKQIVQF